MARSYGAANLRRRNGQDSVAVASASELPMRVAAQQLAALAGMSQKARHLMWGHHHHDNILMGLHANAQRLSIM